MKFHPNNLEYMKKTEEVSLPKVQKRDKRDKSTVITDDNKRIILTRSILYDNLITMAITDSEIANADFHLGRFLNNQRLSFDKGSLVIREIEKGREHYQWFIFFTTDERFWRLLSDFYYAILFGLILQEKDFPEHRANLRGHTVNESRPFFLLDNQKVRKDLLLQKHSERVGFFFALKIIAVELIEAIGESYMIISNQQRDIK